VFGKKISFFEVNFMVASRNIIGEAVDYEQKREYGYDAVDKDASVADIDSKARSLVWWARQRNWNVAADNLEYYLDGKGGSRIAKKSNAKRIPRNWLRGFKKVKATEEELRLECQDGILYMIRSCATPGRDSKLNYNEDFPDILISYSNNAGSKEELFYASGDSRLKASGKGEIEIKQNVVTVRGVLAFTWHDTYNFDKGKGALIPLMGKIPDEAMMRLVKEGKARNFAMVCKYNQLFSANFKMSNWRNGGSWDWGLCL
jgi:hypothetical protein